jgi:Zn finger protein HypA/HybF involved in hydrogenase expression
MTNNELKKESLQRYKALEIDSAPAVLVCSECKTTYKAEHIAIKCASLDIEIAKEKIN